MFETEVILKNLWSKMNPKYIGIAVGITLIPILVIRKVRRR